MAGEVVTKGSRFYCVSLKPDICKTPIGPSTPEIPYTIKGEFADATGVSADITSGGEPVVIHATTVIPSVTGDERGTAKGVKSKTVAKSVQHDQRSSTLSFNGERAIRVGDTVFMNDKNTIGKVFERAASSSGSDSGSPTPLQAAGSSADRSIDKRLQTVLSLLGDPKSAIARAVRASPGVAGELAKEFLRDSHFAAELSAVAMLANGKGRRTIPGNAFGEGESPKAKSGSASAAVDVNGRRAEQGPEFGLAQLQSLSAFIPAALLNKVPGGAAARTLSENVARMSGLLGRKESIASPGAIQNFSEMVQRSSVGIDGGASRGKPVGMVATAIGRGAGTELLTPNAPCPPPPSVSAAGGDARVVNRELAKLPDNVLSALKNGNIRIIAVRDTIVEAFPELHNVVPRGWGGIGKTWDNVPGIFMRDRGVIAVATSDSNATGSGNMILHEVAHGYDHAMGDLSQSLSFTAAYEADRDHYSAYYSQAGVAGREEVFAESFANYYSKNDSYFMDKPHVSAYWKNLPASMQTRSRGK